MIAYDVRMCVYCAFAGLVMLSRGKVWTQALNGSLIILVTDINRNECLCSILC